MADVAPAVANGHAEEPRPVRIGVLALQGSFREHMASLRRLPGVEAVEVRTAEQLRSVDGLIIPGAPS
jgi:pyridoxal 5'-phosphate synthase pdxT subunit